MTSIRGKTASPARAGDGWCIPCLTAGVLAAAIAAAAGSASAETKPGTDGLEIQPIEVSAAAIEGFDKADRGKTTFGAMEWRGGLVLTSPSPHFGGWSGLELDSDGKRLVAVSDAGTWLTAAIAYDGRRPVGITEARIGPLKVRKGKTLGRSRDRDAEALALADGTIDKGSVLIAFEGNHRIGRFPIGPKGIGAAERYLSMPKDTRRISRNGGLEAMTVLAAGPAKGSVVAIAEQLLPGETDHSGWIWQRGEPRSFRLSDIGGYDITDVASLADGALLVLERRFRWSEGVKMRLRFVPAGAVKAGARLEGETLLSADLGQEIDNMEGIAVHEGDGGETIVSLISDDNFSRLLQRTVLLQFAFHRKDVAGAR